MYGITGHRDTGICCVPYLARGRSMTPLNKDERTEFETLYRRLLHDRFSADDSNGDGGSDGDGGHIMGNGNRYGMRIVSPKEERAFGKHLGRGAQAGDAPQGGQIHHVVPAEIDYTDPGAIAAMSSERRL